MRGPNGIADLSVSGECASQCQTRENVCSDVNPDGAPAANGVDESDLEAVVAM